MTRRRLVWLYCPACGERGDETTVEDHGVCYDCHKEILNGERCRECYEPGHIGEQCPWEDDDES